MEITKSWRHLVKQTGGLKQALNAYWDFLNFIVVGFIVSTILLTYVFSRSPDMLNTVVSGVAFVLSKSEPYKNTRFYYFDSDSSKAPFLVKNYTSISQLQKSRDSMATTLLVSSVPSAVFAGLIPLFILRVFGRREKVTPNEVFLRGGEFLPSETLKRRILLDGLGGDLHAGDFPMLKDKETRHFLLTGDTGSGKSTVITQFIDTFRRRGQKAVIWDKSGELIQYFYDADRGDKILAPFDERSEYWTPFAEGVELNDFERLGHSFLPVPADMDEGKKHWPEAALTVFTWLMYRMFAVIKYGSIDELFNKLVGKIEVSVRNRDGEVVKVWRREYLSMLAGTPAELVVDPSSPEHASSVLASLIPKIKTLWYMRGLEDKPLFSIREWVQADAEGFLFIRADANQLKSVRPLVTAWLDTAISTVLSLPQSQTRRIAFIADELQALDKVESIPVALEEGRKFGLSVVLGFPSISTLNSIYGKEVVNTIISMSGTKFIFRNTDDETAQRMAKILLEAEVIADRDNVNFNANNSNLGTSETREKNLLVTPSEIQKLDDLFCYLRLPGNFPSTKLVLTYQPRVEVAKPMVLRKLPLPVSYANANEAIPDSQNKPKAASLNINESFF